MFILFYIVCIIFVYGEVIIPTCLINTYVCILIIGVVIPMSYIIMYVFTVYFIMQVIW